MLASKLLLTIFLTVIFVVPIVDYFCSLMITPEFFAFRAWDIATRRDNIGPFQANFSFSKVIFGDLANMAGVRTFRSHRNQKFTTDKFGFRNPRDLNFSECPVVTIGDSDMAGSSMSDSNIYSELLSKKLNINIYNYAPYGPLHLLGDPRFQKNKPKVIIWESIERTINSRTFFTYSSNNLLFGYNLGIPSQKAHYPVKKLSEYYAVQFYKEFLWRLTGIVNQQVIYQEDQKLLFYKEGVDVLNHDNSERGLKEVANAIISVSRAFAKLGVTIVFLSIPDKENIYQRFLPLRTQHSATNTIFLDDLHRSLKENNVYSINLLESFRTSSINKLLFYPDDTHWNEAGVQLAVDETVRFFKETPNVFKENN